MRAVVYFVISFALLLFYSCSPVSKRNLDKTFRLTEDKFHDHTGFILYDPKEKRTLYEYNASRYFTPASNTKIFTFYTSLKIIGDSIPAIKYIESGDSLIFWGTADPSLLYRNVYDSSKTINFFKNTSKKLYFSSSNFQTERFGPGWAWDDYNDYYSAERSPFPIYGNIVSITAENRKLSVKPNRFNNLVDVQKPGNKFSIVRDLNANRLKFTPANSFKRIQRDIPFKVSDTLVLDLLSDTIQKPITITNRRLEGNAKLIYSVRTDSLYKVMMQQSDNFVAEQLLLICSGILSDTLKPEIAINYAKKNLFKGFKEEPIWVDGSGLSRYNLFTPRSLSQLWELIYNTVPQERLFKLLPTGGKGTMKTAYKSDTPYVFAKTGTLSNNHNLSGYLLTKKGSVLIFAFMNNNYVTTTAEIRKNMEEILIKIRDHF